MPRRFKQDPYCGFKSDELRLKALNTRVRWRTAGLVATDGGMGGFIQGLT